jgi:hypothetical protein
MRIIVLAVIATACASAADYKIASVSHDSKLTKITVRFTGTMPSKADAENPSHWSVTAYAPDAIDATVVPRVAAEYELFGQVNLQVTFNTAVVNPDYILVVFHANGQVADKAQSFNRKAPPSGATKPEGRDDSSIYAFGGINAGVGAKPTFNIDSFIDLYPTLSGFDFNASVKTDNRKKVDPDSFMIKLGYEWALGARGHSTSSGPHFGGVKFKFLPAGTEFDRARKNLNYAGSGLMFLGFHAWNPGNTIVWNLTPRLGLEAGNNFRNSLNDNGLGGFVRALGGGTNIFIFRKIPGFDRVSLTTDYEVRLPNQAELFSDSTIKVNGQDTPVYRYSRQARHHLTNDLSLMLNDYWGFSVKHEYGSLPPTFNLVNHKVSIGLTFKVKVQ